MSFTQAFDTPSFYFPLMSKLDLFYGARELLSKEEFMKLDEESGLKEHCLTISLDRNATMTIMRFSGFDGKTGQVLVKFSENFPGRWDYVVPKCKFSSQAEFFSQKQIGNFFYSVIATIGTTYIVLSDNQHGMLLVSYWLSGTKTFALAVPSGMKPTNEFLSNATKLLVEDYGFSPANFVHSSYESCQGKQEL